MNDERSDDPGVGPPVSGSGDNGEGADGQSAGPDETSTGSGSNGGHGRRSSPEWTKWAGIAGAFVAVIVLLAQMYGDITGNTEKSDQIIEKVQKVPGIINQVEDLKNQIEDQPTPTSTTIIKKGEPGKPGAPGKPGQVVTSPPQTKYIETPGPTKTIRPSAQPTCNTSLIGTCLVP